MAEPVKPMPALMDVEAVASLLSCSRRHVYRQSEAGRIPPPVKIGALTRWRYSELAQWLGNGCPFVSERGAAQ